MTTLLIISSAIILLTAIISLAVYLEKLDNKSRYLLHDIRSSEFKKTMDKAFEDNKVVLKNLADR